jgi:hypothetical protein
MNNFLSKYLNALLRLRKLELPTLSYRWLKGDMIEVYKIIQGHYDPEASTIIKLELYM